MSVARDIIRTYFAPRETLRRKIGAGAREDRALATLFGACILIFIAQWPGLAREAHLNEGSELDMLMGAALFGWVFVAPLLLYALAAFSHILARIFGGQGTWFRARMALFWALLAASPLWLLHGLVKGFIGPGAALQAVGFLALGAFLVFWGTGLWEAEGRKA
ncbi:MAG: YIP1 family protein [Pseudomonadota bacterium]